MSGGRDEGDSCALCGITSRQGVHHATLRSSATDFYCSRCVLELVEMLAAKASMTAEEWLQDMLATAARRALMRSR